MDTQISKGALLNQEEMFVVNDLAVLQFLAEQVWQNPQFEEQLHKFIEESKMDEDYRVAAANAITILVKAGVCFNNKILTGI